VDDKPRSWIRLPDDGRAGLWHLEAPTTIRRAHLTMITHSACGRRFVASEPELIERIDSTDSVSEEDRCAACQATYSDGAGNVGRRGR
jgi:hypothetical protein